MKKFRYYKDNELRDNIKAYRNGKRDFNSKELNDIKLYASRYKDLIDNIKYFSGSVKNYKTISCFAEDFFEELHDRMINAMGADIAIIAILSTKEVLLKKNNKTCNIDICKLSQIICDGVCIESNENIAIGKFTNNFINLTKKFIQCS